MTEAEFQESKDLGAPPEIAASPWVVLKFGGTSVSTAKNWQTIATIVRNRLDAGLRPVVVHSALSGISNALVAALTTAVREKPGSIVAEIRDRHVALGKELGIDAAALLAQDFEKLEKMLSGIELVGEVGVRVQARVMALGELMSTRLGAAWLNEQGIATEWHDARELLTSVDRRGSRRDRDFLAATCGFDADPTIAERFGPESKVHVVPGFIACNARGETVILGRGGSDTSAAYLAARLQARRLEIWSDVPGIFSANPKVVPSARLLVSLRYDEAQELASAGSAVLHPRCISPLRPHGIPLFLRSTESPGTEGTVISAVTEEIEPQVKGICVRSGLTLVSMESVGMWHEVGFLARAFSVFSEHGLSVDFVSTSETSVTVSIDTVDGPISEDIRDALIAELSEFCRVRVTTKCAAVSLVGRKIRTILPRLVPAFEVFEEEKIHLMTQAENDLNLSFVIDENQTERLVNKLHATVIRRSGGSPAFGPSWEDLFRSAPVVDAEPEAWWLRRRSELLAIANDYPNAYVYDRDSVRDAAKRLLDIDSIDRVLYAVKANYNPDLLEVLDAAGVDFECVSPGEVDWVREVLPEIDKDRILFTPNFAPRAEYAWALEQGLRLTVDSLYPLQAWPELFDGRRIFIRVNPGQGRGHHEHVRTAGVHSKFGVARFEIDELVRLVERCDARVVGIHGHSGSGVLDTENWRQIGAELTRVAQRFPDVEVVDLGGGLGIPEKPGDRPFNLSRLEQTFADIRNACPDYRLWIEPGRFLVARGGVLLTRVTQVKGEGGMKYVGVGAGMNALIRPALYGSYHEIINLSRVSEAPAETVTVVGPICETGDRLGTDRLLPRSEEGDVILIANAGAYGYVMSSNYNRRGLLPEVVI